MVMGMRKFLACLFFSCSLCSIALADDLQDGFQAFSAGNYEEAMRLWHPLAEKNNADAQYNLGIMYMKGLGVEQNDKRALIWFKRAAALEHDDAMYNLGVLYMQGSGVVRSPKDALYWWQQSASRGNPFAQYNLGVLYAYGTAVAQNTDQAIYWWERAARQGQPEAQQALHRMYSEGLFGITPDPAKAAEWQPKKTP